MQVPDLNRSIFRHRTATTGGRSQARFIPADGRGYNLANVETRPVSALVAGAFCLAAGEHAAAFIDDQHAAMSWATTRLSEAMQAGSSRCQ